MIPDPRPGGLCPDALLLLVENRLQRLIAELPPGWPPTPTVVEASIRGTYGVLRLGSQADVQPAAIPTDGRPLKGCLLAALTIAVAEFQRRGRRVVGADIVDAMKGRRPPVVGHHHQRRAGEVGPPETAAQ